MIKLHLLIISIIAIIPLSNIFSQEIPVDFRVFQKRKLFLEIGNNWESQTIFGPIRYDYKNITSDSLITNARFGTRLFNNKKMLYGYGHFTYKINYHGYLYSRIDDSPNQFYRYSGIPRDIERGGFNSGETDVSAAKSSNENGRKIQFNLNGIPTNA